MRDLKASSKVPTRFEVKMSIPALYSRIRRKTETREFRWRSERLRSSKKTSASSSRTTAEKSVLAHKSSVSDLILL